MAIALWSSRHPAANRRRIFSTAAKLSRSERSSILITFWLHKFRATFATWTLWKQVDLSTVQSYLGHSDIESTMRYLKPAGHDHVREKMNSVFDRGVAMNTVKRLKRPKRFHRQRRCWASRAGSQLLTTPSISTKSPTCLGSTRKRLNEWRGLAASHLSKSVIRFVSIPAILQSGRRLPGATSGSGNRPSAGSL